ncbi:YqiA/YcfP family alpha/beta fold hydrolase [Microbulbifer sp. ZKSA006]|uniref:YqiA/YcfP family alpha/beta fold hydrolase n=1 Tax=Microbulbifer sp. ZKSA006 TaxID=3243390 RepID=UPI004039F997
MQTHDLQGRPLLIYLHGFLSSPQSFKCQLMREWLKANYPQVTFCAPQISPYTDRAQQSLLTLLEGFLQEPKRGPIGLVGSSMGGFWCTYLGERFQLPAALINPAVRPARFIPAYVGRALQPYSGEEETFCLSQVDVDTMQRVQAELDAPLESRYWLLAQRGDEVLDYRDAQDFYQGQRQTIEDGGDHSFQEFARYCDPIIEFLFNEQ